MNKTILKSGILLFAFTLVSLFFVNWTQNSTQEKIQYNERQLLILRLGELVSNYDNDILQDKYSKEITLHGIKQQINIYPAKRNKVVFAYLIEHRYPNGYNGNIHLLTGVSIEQNYWVCVLLLIKKPLVWVIKLIPKNQIGLSNLVACLCPICLKTNGG